MIYTEQRLLVGMFQAHMKPGRHFGDPYQEWGILEMAKASIMKYRQVANSLRRLVPCRWVERVGRGVYRLTSHALESMRPWVTRTSPSVSLITPINPARARKKRRRAK
jgi:hypothetical protein